MRIIELGNKVYPYGPFTGSIRDRAGINVKFTSPVTNNKYVVNFIPDFNAFELLDKFPNIPRKTSDNSPVLKTVVNCGFYIVTDI